MPTLFVSLQIADVENTSREGYGRELCGSTIACAQAMGTCICCFKMVQRSTAASPGDCVRKNTAIDAPIRGYGCVHGTPTELIDMLIEEASCSCT